MARDFEWDPNKDKRNKKKHNVSFNQATGIFNDENAVTYEDTRQNYGEVRLITIGKIIGAIVFFPIMLVVWTQRGRRKRLISARPANKKERRLYVK